MTEPCDPLFPAGWSLVTSNENKRREFARLGLDLPSVAIDLPEVDGTPLEVILQKSLSAGPMTVCEDTSLDVDGAAVGVNVRWLLDGVADLAGRRAAWRVLVASNDGASVVVHEGVVNGTIVMPSGRPGFGFDPVFAPDGFGGATLADLEADGRKDGVSARRLAVAAFLGGHTPLHAAALADIPEWTGSWQAHP